jgi:tripartite-type tricarboxylate transporter receptor subunit TctC
LTIDPWGGLFGPAGLPRDVVDRLNREMLKVLARPDVREQLGRQAFDPQGSTPDEFRAFVRDQLRAWKTVALEAGIQPK